MHPKVERGRGIRPSRYNTPANEAGVLYRACFAALLLNDATFDRGGKWLGQ
ncbi:MAG: hypothetical protein NVSMB42_12010 [Herpetosiphon sp.]